LVRCRNILNTVEVKEERCSLAYRTFSPDATTVSMDNSLHRGQSDTGPGKLVIQVEPLAGAEEPAGVSHIDEPFPSHSPSLSPSAREAAVNTAAVRLQIRSVVVTTPPSGWAFGVLSARAFHVEVTDATTGRLAWKRTHVGLLS